MKKNLAQHSSLFLYLAVAFVSCLLLSNLIAGKLISVFGAVVPAAVILFPITYILGDVFTEVYGFRAARKIIWCGFACCLLAVVVYAATIVLPYPDYWNNQDAYATVLGTTPRIFAASIAGYLFGEFLNSVVLSKMKVRANGKRLWHRTILSSVVGQALDTLIFIAIAFSGMYETSVIWGMIAFQYIWKLCYEAALTPLTCFVINRVKQREGVDVYDVGEKYNPFKE